VATTCELFDSEHLADYFITCQVHHEIFDRTDPQERESNLLASITAEPASGA